jgi:alkaline phosphatase D
MAADAPDLILHLGDYIYESSLREGALRPHGNPQPENLQQYRNRYACYKLDADLQAAHAAAPWMTTWDDHEVDNDYAGDYAAYRGSPEAFLLRRAAAYQAYWEHLPLRPSMRPRGASLPLYRGAACGDLLDISVLDSRQYRDDQPCALPPKELGGRMVGNECAERLDPSRSLLGAEQERWLYARFGKSRARWNLIAQQLLMAQLDQQAGDGQAWWSDGWEGYPMARKRLIDQMAQRRLRNPIVIGGDIHSFWACDLKRDFNDPRSATVATEFVGGSISSRGVPYQAFEEMLPDNPHIHFFESRKRGYGRCRLTPKAWQTDFIAIDDAERADSSARVLKSFTVEAGRPGIEAT